MSNIEHLDLTIEQFESGSIDAEIFDHDSFGLFRYRYRLCAWLLNAIARFDVALRHLTRKLGVAGKYHATITWIFLLLIAERSHAGEDWQMFKTRNRDLIDESRNTLGRYYSEELLFSEAARKQFMLPDRLMCDPLA